MVAYEEGCPIITRTKTMAFDLDGGHTIAFDSPACSCHGPVAGIVLLLRVSCLRQFHQLSSVYYDRGSAYLSAECRNSHNFHT